MKYRKLAVLIVVGILLAALTFSGCSAGRFSLSDRDIVSVEKQDGEKVKILWTDVYQQDGKTWACGVLRQPKSATSPVKTHLDIRILAPDGSKYYEGFSKALYVPPSRFGKSPDWKRFKVPLPKELPKGSQITIIVHSAGHETI